MSNLNSKMLLLIVDGGYYNPLVESEPHKPTISLGHATLLQI